MNSFLSKLRAKPARLEFSETPWAPLDVISVLAREGESLSTKLAAEPDDDLHGPERGSSQASTTGRRLGELILVGQEKASNGSCQGFISCHFY